MIIKGNYLYELKEANDIAENSDGESDSEFCSGCRGTGYGEGNNFSVTPNGYSSCEGSWCGERIKEIQDELSDEYITRREEIKNER